MTDLSPEARRMLAQAKAGQAVAPQALRERVKRHVDRAIVAAAVSDETARPASATRAWVLPSAGALIVLGGLALSVALLSSANTPSAARVRPPQHASAPSKVAESEPLPTAASPVSPAQPLPAATPEIVQPPTVSATARSAPSAGDLRAEMQLLSRAEAALRSDDPHNALQLLRTHAQKFRSGQLHEERDGLRLIALCTLGRDPGAALPSYLDKHNDAVLHVRVSEACSRFVP